MVMIPSGASEAGGDGDDFGAAGVPEDFGFLFAAGLRQPTGVKILEILHFCLLFDVQFYIILLDTKKN